MYHTQNVVFPLQTWQARVQLLSLKLELQTRLTSLHALPPSPRCKSHRRFVIMNFVIMNLKLACFFVLAATTLPPGLSSPSLLSILKKATQNSWAFQWFQFKCLDGTCSAITTGSRQASSFLVTRSKLRRSCTVSLSSSPHLKSMLKTQNIWTNRPVWTKQSGAPCHTSLSNFTPQVLEFYINDSLSITTTKKRSKSWQFSGNVLFIKQRSAKQCSMKPW